MSNTSYSISFFLGANSAGGFASLYNTWIDQTSIQAFYTIKGGAGCGKSTLMKTIAQQLQAEGYAVEHIFCSGDPDSLDGIHIPQKAVAMVDGTAPHRMDPAYPGATGHYVDLGTGYDRKALFAKREEVIQATAAYQACYPAAYACLRMAQAKRLTAWASLRAEETQEKVEKRAKSLLSPARKELRTQAGKRYRRFLGGPTCQGMYFLSQSPLALCATGYVLQGETGLAPLLLEHLETGFLAAGYDVVSCPDPIQPELLAHLLIPELDLAFVTGPIPPEAGYRTIRTESLTGKAIWQENRASLREALRQAEEEQQAAITHLAKAKSFHDTLEELYRPHVDFQHTDQVTRDLLAEISALPDRPEQPLASAFFL